VKQSGMKGRPWRNLSATDSGNMYFITVAVKCILCLISLLIVVFIIVLTVA
jgi:hypothetical protein